MSAPHPPPAARPAPLDGRDPDHSRTGIFVHHDCWRRNHGALPCANGSPNRCENPRARND